MVPTENIVAIVVVLVVSVLLPVIGWFIVRRRAKVNIINALVGAGIFFICFIIAVVTSMLGSALIASPIILTLVLSLRAGLVEEFGRFVAFKWILKRSKTVNDALMYGVGHGGVEVLLVLSMSMISNLVFVATVNSGALDVMAAAAPDQAAAIYAAAQTLIETSPLLFGAGLVERIIAMVLHISLSVIVFCAVRQRKWLYLLLAIALHTLLNSSIVLMIVGIVGVWGLELVLACIVVCVALIAWRIARAYRPPAEPWETAPPPEFQNAPIG